MLNKLLSSEFIAHFCPNYTIHVDLHAFSKNDITERKINGDYF